MAKGSEVVTEADMVRLADGKIEEDRRLVILEQAKHDTSLAARIDVLAKGSPSLEHAFSPLLKTMPPTLEGTIRSLADKTHASMAPVVSRRWFGGGIAVAASFVGGAVAGGLLFNRGSSATDWREAVAQYHALYGKATTERLNPTPEERDRDLSVVSQALGQSLLGIEKTAPAFTFKRAQVLEFEGAPLIQIVFETANRIPVAFCLKKSRQISRPVETESRHGMALSAWTREGMDELVVAKLPVEEIKVLAELLASRG